MFYWLKRHPIPIKAFFRHSLVLTYAFPKTLLEPLLPPGLSVDTHGGFGFLAIALVQTQGLRPTFAPHWLGKDVFLSGYRIFARFEPPGGRRLRGLRILRSDADSGVMVRFGNSLTHYAYRKAEVILTETADTLEIRVKTPRGEADLHVIADLANRPAPLPPGSPFADRREARKFAGPLPFTFDYEKETHSLVLIEGVRENWDPQPVRVEVKQNTFLDQPPFCQAPGVLANAFHVSNIPYLWRQGVRVSLPRAGELRQPAGAL